jgi:hypothetical protein
MPPSRVGMSRSTILGRGTACRRRGGGNSVVVRTRAGPAFRSRFDIVLVVCLYRIRTNSRCSDRHLFTWPAVDAEDLSGLFSRAAEPVRYRGVELGDLPRSKHPIAITHDESHLPGKDVDPFVTVVSPRLRPHLARRDDDLLCLHTVGLPGQLNDCPALDVSCFEPDPRIADLRGADQIIERHTVGLGERQK